MLDETVGVRHVPFRLDLDSRKRSRLTEVLGELLLRRLVVGRAFLKPNDLDLVEQHRLGHERQELERKGATHLDVCFCFHFGASQDLRLKYWTARSCRSAAARVSNVPRLRRASRVPSGQARATIA